MNFILRKDSVMGCVDSEQAKGAAMTGNGHSDSAANTMFEQPLRRRKSGFLGEIIEYNWLTDGPDETRLSVVCSRNSHGTETSLRPSDPSSKDQRSRFRLQFKDVAIFDLQGLGSEHDDLVQERIEVLGDEGELA